MYHAKFKSIIVLMGTIALSSIGFGADSKTAPASTEPIYAGRDTPAGAMNVLMLAIDRGDYATVVDSFNESEWRGKMLAHQMISQRRFYRALEKQFGKAMADSVCRECGIRSFPEKHYVASDWQYPPKIPYQVYGKVGPMMEKGEDDIWRIGRIVHPPPLPPGRAAQVAAMRTKMQQRAALQQQQFDAVVKGVETKKYPTTAAVVRALFPQGTPMEQMRQMEARQKAEDARQEQQLMAAHFDPSTIGGAVGAYMQAQKKRDVAGIANFFYAQDDLKGRLAKAKAERFVAAMQLQDAVQSKIADARDQDISDEAGAFESIGDAPWWADVQEHGDSATGTFEGGQKISYRNLNGVWKEDITSSVPSARRAVVLERGTAAVKAITTDILAGKITTIAQVRAALQKSHLAAREE